MSIKNDNWIKLQSTGPKFNYYYKNELVHENVTLDFFRFEDVMAPLHKLEIGQSYMADPDTRIQKTINGDMITPFVDHSVKEIVRNGQFVKAPSYGLSSYGYDIRLGRNFKVMNGYRKAKHTVIDPTEPENMEGFFTDINDVDAIEMAPHSFALGVAMERLVMPNDVMGICMPKSTLARIGLTAHITPCENSWVGYLTIELKNETDHPIRVHAGMGIMQLLFIEGEPCNTTYADRNGKYQNQSEFPTVAR